MGDSCVKFSAASFFVYVHKTVCVVFYNGMFRSAELFLSVRGGIVLVDRTAAGLT